MRTRAGLLLTVAALTLAGACGGDSDDEETPRAAPVPLLVNLCEAREAASADPAETGAAQEAFAAAHDDLHALADRLTARDRAAATGFFRAKQRVEADLAGGADAATLEADLRALLDETYVAAEALDAPVVPDCR
ncbi:MAG: hypothetical protein ACRDY7_02735 [Acidimicrobiia bacterium]